MPNGWLNVPHFRQEFNYSCVAACVRMVMAYYGHNESEDNVGKFSTSMGNDGTLGSPYSSTVMREKFSPNTRCVAQPCLVYWT